MRVNTGNSKNVSPRYRCSEFNALVAVHNQTDFHSRPAVVYPRVSASLSLSAGRRRNRRHTRVVVFKRDMPTAAVMIRTRNKTCPRGRGTPQVDRKNVGAFRRQTVCNYHYHFIMKFRRTTPPT